MTNLREAAQMALDALNNFDKGNHGMRWQVPVIKALRAALAQPEQEKTRSEKLRDAGYTRRPKGWDKDDGPEQKPVAFYVYKPTLPRGNLGNVADGDLPWIYDQDPSSGYSARMLVYTAPPQREWQGLTKDEVNNWELPESPTVYEFAQFVEAKLKEKNLTTDKNIQISDKND